jgi:hypothetical protein
MKNFYRLRHIPTGLFFTPSKNGWGSHLTKVGKAYNKKPSKSYIESGVEIGDYPNIKTVLYVEGEWEIVVYEAVEKSTIPV